MFPSRDVQFFYVLYISANSSLIALVRLLTVFSWTVVKFVGYLPLGILAGFSHWSLVYVLCLLGWCSYFSLSLCLVLVRMFCYALCVLCHKISCGDVYSVYESCTSVYVFSVSCVLCHCYSVLTFILFLWLCQFSYFQCLYVQCHCYRVLMYLLFLRLCQFSYF